ncbi:MAG: chorismate mutase [Clostridia bacterium]|nr:chorismate mutase [Clostridia bacterium]
MMKELADIRKELDSVDREIVALFEKRMLLCREVAQYKITRGLPVLDRSREEQVLENRASMLSDPYWRDSVRELFEGIMALSRAEQEQLLREAGR